MCYYSTTIPRAMTRSAKEGEDLVLTHDGQGHGFPTASNGKIVCMRSGAEFHTEKLEMVSYFARDVMRHHPQIKAFLGKPIDTHFREQTAYAPDCIMVGGMWLPLAWLKPGMTFYTGPKKVVPLETRLGVDDPSIVLDHRDVTTEEPSMARALGRALGVCSIVR